MHFLLLGVLLLGGLVPVSLESQQVRGSVLVEGTQTSVAGARIVLLDLSEVEILTVQTDFQGRFIIAAPSSGSFRLLVDRPGFINMLSERFFLDDDVVAEVDFSIKPEPVELVAGPNELEDAFSFHVEEKCGVLPDGSLSPALVGLVTDASSGVVLPGVSVSLEWSERGGGLHVIQTRTEGDGIYAICDPPVTGRPRIRAQTMGLTGDLIELEARLSRIDRVDLGLPLTEAGTTGQVLGQIVDYESGKELSTVEVSIRGEGLWTLSDQRGYFRFDHVPPGVHVLEVYRVGYAHQEKMFRVVGRAGHQLDVALAQDAILLDPITVEVRSSRWYDDMAGLQDRMAGGLGYFLTRPDLIGRGLTRLADATYGIPGFMVRRIGRYATLVTRGRECTPSVFLDGVPHALDPTLGLDGIQVFDLEAIEFYRGPNETPSEFSNALTCATLVAWTRRGR